MRNNEEIIDIIKESRKSKKMSISELARQTGIAKSSLSRYENKSRQFPIDQIDTFAKVLHLDPEYILGLSPKNTNSKTEYNYYDTGLSAGMLTEVDPFTRNDVQTVALSDVIMGKYAGDKDVFISRLNGESMNRVIPSGSMIAVKKYKSLQELCDGDIVIFQDGGDMSVKRYYNSPKNRTITFNPDSSDTRFYPITYRYEDLDDIRILGKVVVYTVNLR